MNISRKNFLKAVGIAGAGLMVNPLPSEAHPSVASSHSFELGLASYTFRKLSLEQTIEYAKKLGVINLALKSMHMPLDASPEEIQRIAKTVRDAGLNLYGAGVIYMKTEQKVNDTFEYAKNAGLKMIIGVPNHDLLPLSKRR